MRYKTCQHSDLQNVFKEGQWQISLIEKAEKLAKCRGRSTDWITYVDICHTLRGMGLEHCKSLGTRSTASQCLSTKLRLKLCNTILTGSFQPPTTLSERQTLCKELLEADKFSIVSTFMDILGSGYLGSSLSHYPVLLTDSTVYPAHRANFSWSLKNCHDAAMKLKESTVSLQEGLVKILCHGIPRPHDPDGFSATVAMVGNSPALLGQGKGGEIDSHDLIVRFNNISSDIAHVEHTGKRTDIWVMSPSTPIEYCPPDAKLVMVSGLHSLTRPSFYWRDLPSLGKPLGEFDASVWYELVQQFNAPPSAGTLAIAAFQSTTLKLHIQRFGFTTTQGVHGSSPNHHNDQAKVSSRHNWQAEVNWLRDSIS